MIENNGVQNSTNLFGCSSDSLNTVILLSNEVENMTRWKDNPKEYRKEYNKKNKDKINKQNKEWRIKNKKHIKQYAREYSKNHREHKNYIMKKWRERNKEHITQYSKEHDNVDKHLEWNRIWREKNKDYLNFKRTLPESIETERINAEKQRKKFPEKIKARMRARYFKKSTDKCTKCNSANNLHFHHTNYEKDEGYILCTKCHGELHVTLNRV